MIDIGFEWSRARDYECAEVEGLWVIRPIAEKRDKVEPLKIDGDKPLYIRFADLDGSEDACRQFACTWGLLTTELPGKAETLDGWRREIKKLKGMMKLLSVGETPPGGIVRTSNSRRVRLKMTSIDVSLLSGKFDERSTTSGRPALVLQPKNLLDAMHLQLAKFVAGDGSLQACRQCGEWFERGATESRRSIAIFCSEKCKNRFHYLERAKR